MSEDWPVPYYVATGSRGTDFVFDPKKTFTYKEYEELLDKYDKKTDLSYSRVSKFVDFYNSDIDDDEFDKHTTWTVNGDIEVEIDLPGHKEFFTFTSHRRDIGGPITVYQLIDGIQTQYVKDLLEYEIVSTMLPFHKMELDSDLQRFTDHEEITFYFLTDKLVEFLNSDFLNMSNLSIISQETRFTKISKRYYDFITKVKVRGFKAIEKLKEIEIMLREARPKEYYLWTEFTTTDPLKTVRTLKELSGEVHMKTIFRDFPKSINPKKIRPKLVILE
ncbi:hypothetical protein [Carp edema virus]|nr:hypothetical protein [Carp edema virus]